MPRYTAKQFGNVIGKSREWVGMQIRRNHLVQKDGRIDTDNPINGNFIKKWLRIKESNERIEAEKNQTTKIEIADGVEVELPPPSVERIAPTRDSNEAAVDLEREKKVAEIEAKRATTEYQQLRAAKLRGEMLPTELVTQMITTLSRSLQMAYRSSAEGLLTEIGHRHKMTTATLSGYKSDLISAINDAHDTAVDVAEREVRNMIIDLADWGEDETNGDDGKQRPTIEL